MNQYIVDRIEEGVAVCELEDGSFLKIPLEQLPQETEEGDCLTEQDGVYLIDQEETLRRREYLAEKLRRLTNKNQ